MTAKPPPLYYAMRALAILIQSLTFGTIYIYLSPDTVPFTEIWQRAIAVVMAVFSLAACVFFCCYNEDNLRKLRRQCALPDTFFSRVPSTGMFVTWYSIPANLIRQIPTTDQLRLALICWVPFFFAVFTVVLRYIVTHDDFLKRFKDLKRKLADLLPKRVPQIAS